VNVSITGVALRLALAATIETRYLPAGRDLPVAPPATATLLDAATPTDEYVLNARVLGHAGSAGV
jgi:hypothetical protein